MATYEVSANGTDFGVFEAACEQEARDLCAQEAGYQSERDMELRLDESSALQAKEAK